MERFIERANAWIRELDDPNRIAQVKQMIDERDEELVSAFGNPLSMGTAGFRAKMGEGPSRMNVTNVQKITQGLANLLLLKKEDRQIAIGYDARHYSREFAEAAASVLAGNGIPVLLHATHCPTPLLSFACSFFRCSGGLMITASHNPPSDNGYKVYGPDGSQIVDANEEELMEAIAAVDEIREAPLSHLLITEIGTYLKRSFLKQLEELADDFPQNQREGAALSLICSPLHGVGYPLLKEALMSWGFSSIIDVEKEAIPDGDFPTISTPNPEKESALKAGIALLIEKEGDLFMATDPDADRLAVVVRKSSGEVHILNGHQIALLCLHRQCEVYAREKDPEKKVCLASVVITPLLAKIAQSYGISYEVMLPGFKNVGKAMRHWETEDRERHLLFAAEDSLSFLCGDYLREKDGIGTACIIAEMARKCKTQGQSLWDQLIALYEEFGFYWEAQRTIPQSNPSFQHLLRSHPPDSLQGRACIRIEDALTGRYHNLPTGEEGSFDMPKADLLIWHFENNLRIILRPSGTEPIFKCYASVEYQGAWQGVEEAQKQSQNILDQALDELEELLTQESFLDNHKDNAGGDDPAH
ncbi:MAG: phospho-sugar mutase [Chlamydiota bacterium]|nr:phospho-sugar mutase [Chlamydiota bacterium]